MNIFNMSVDAAGIATVVIDTPNRPVNTMDQVYVSEFIQLVTKLENKKPEISGVILTSAKSTFIAGGDLKYMMSVTEETQDAFVDWLNTIKATLRRLETLGRPVVAAINGSALGGGYETCLSCHHRIALNNEKNQIGVPEVGLGLMPAAGGVSRLIRLLGYEKALPYLLEGTRVGPEKALADGLIDELAATPEELLEKARAWIRGNPAAKQPWDVPGFELPGGGSDNPAISAMLASMQKALHKKAGGLYPASEAILAAAIECGTADIENAGRIESRYFIDLLMGPVARSMVTAFFEKRT